MGTKVAEFPILKQNEFGQTSDTALSQHCKNARQLKKYKIDDDEFLTLSYSFK